MDKLDKVKSTQNEMTKKEIYLIILIIIIITLIPIVFFINTFFDSLISNDIANWGAFGDYFGGILNSFFSFISLLVTIYIAYKISKIDENRNKENLKFEKEKLLREFREAEYKRVNYELQKVWTYLTESNSEIAIKIIHDVIWQYRYFRTSNKHLFPFLDESEIINLQKTLTSISKLFKEPIDTNKKNEVIAEFISDFDKFNLKFQLFLLKN